MDFYEQARLLSSFFAQWTDFQICLYNRDMELTPDSTDIHCHESYELRGRLTPEGEPIGPLELFLPDVMHGAYNTGRLEESFSISFEPLLLRYKAEQSFFFVSPYEDRLKEVFGSLKTGGLQSSALREECRLLLVLLFLRAAPAQEPLHSNSVELMGHYISRHYYRSDFSIRELARQFGYSPNYVQRCFRKLFGVTPREYLQNARMTAAVRLMQNKQYRIKELSALCGFQDVHHFSKTFRRYYGVSPSGYFSRKKKDKQN